MENNLLDTKTVNSNEVLGNGKKYFVPTYQRDYSWKQDNWEDLWADILLVLESDKVHYMGAIVLQHKEAEQYTVIDGQQRLTTVTIIALACIQAIRNLIEQGIEKEQNEERIRILSHKFIGDKDPTSLIYSSKLQLNENNNLFFQMNILTLRRPAPVVELKLRDSDKLLLNCFDFFYAKITQYFADKAKGESIAKLLNETIAKNLIFTQIIVENELQAYTVFETLNSRGMALSLTDLLKNYLFSLASKFEIAVISEKWNKIVDSIGLDFFPVFLRHYWISKNNLVRQEYLYKSIRTKILNVDDLFNLLEDLEKNVTVYVALNNPSDELWRGNKELKKRIKELELFQTKQCLPLLLIAFDKLPSIFEKILKIVTVISFRSTVIGGSQNGKSELIYNAVSMKIASDEIHSIQEIATEVQHLYPNDTDFKNDFSTIVINTRQQKKLVRYILFELENQLCNNGSAYDFEENPATIEHILPENATEEWDAFFPKNSLTNYVFRLGNYTLLEDGKNREIGNKPYIEKLPTFKTSNFKLTNELAYPEWNANNLDKRQFYLAKLATAVWKLPYYTQ